MADIVVLCADDGRTLGRLACTQLLDLQFDAAVAAPGDGAVSSGARAVLVLWSPEAVKSDPMRADAIYAREHRLYVGGVARPCVLLPPFNILQNPDLSQWDGASAAPAWLGVVEALDRHAGREGTRAWLEAGQGLLSQEAWLEKHPSHPLAPRTQAHLAANAGELTRIKEEKREQEKQRWERVDRETAVQRKKQEERDRAYEEHRRREREAESKRAARGALVSLLVLTAVVVAGVFLYRAVFP